MHKIEMMLKMGITGIIIPKIKVGKNFYTL